MIVSRKSVAHTLRSLRHRNYRLFFFGQSISLVGTWLQQMALPWITFEMTGRELQLGLVGFLSQFPILLLGPFVGVLVDRSNRLYTVIGTQAAAMIQALVLAWLALSGQLEVWHIFVLSAALGVINAFDVPTRQALMFDLIDVKHDLSNAIALNSSMVNLARMIGPAVAAVLIGVAGAGVCFLLNGLSYVAVLLSLLLIRIPPPPPREKKREDFLHSLMEGVRYALGFSPIRNTIMLVGLCSFTAMAYTVLMPAYIKTTLHGDERDFGVLMAASGLGALISAVYLAAQPTVRGMGKAIPIGAALGGVSMIAFGFTHDLYVASLLRLTGSAGILLQMAASNTILQTIVEPRQRGRLMAFYTMAFIGMAPLGSLAGGWMAEHLGSLTTILIMGALTLLGGLAYAARMSHMRTLVVPIYDRLDIPHRKKK